MLDTGEFAIPSDGSHDGDGLARGRGEELEDDRVSASSLAEGNDDAGADGDAEKLSEWPVSV